MAGDFIIIPFIAAHFLSASSANYILEQKISATEIKPVTSILKYRQSLADTSNVNSNNNDVARSHSPIEFTQKADVGKFENVLLTNRTPELIKQVFPFHEELQLSTAQPVKLRLAQQEQEHLGWKIKIPADAKKQSIIQFDLLQRNAETNVVTGGISVEIRIV